MGITVNLLLASFSFLWLVWTLVFIYVEPLDTMSTHMIIGAVMALLNLVVLILFVGFLQIIGPYGYVIVAVVFSVWFLATLFKR